MIKRRFAAALAAPAAVPARAAMGMMHLEAGLRGGYPHAAGHADYQSGWLWGYAACGSFLDSV